MAGYLENVQPVTIYAPDGTALVTVNGGTQPVVTIKTSSGVELPIGTQGDGEPQEVNSVYVGARLMGLNDAGAWDRAHLDADKNLKVALYGGGSDSVSLYAASGDLGTTDITVQTADAGAFTTPVDADFDLRNADARTLKIPVASAGFKHCAIHVRGASLDQIVDMSIQATAGIVATNVWPKLLDLDIPASVARFFSIIEASGGQGSAAGGATVANGESYAVPALVLSGPNVYLRYEAQAVPTSGSLQFRIHRWF